MSIVFWHSPLESANNPTCVFFCLVRLSSVQRQVRCVILFPRRYATDLPKKERNREIIKYNLIGIGINLILSAIKLIVGLSAHSMAIVLDGVNGFSDMLSSMITIIAGHAAARKSTKAHPLGFGRLEHLSSMLITMLIMYTGVRAIIGSVNDIRAGSEPPEYTRLVIFVMIASVVMKLAYVLLLRIQGKRLNSAAMIMAGTEGLGDVLIRFWGNDRIQALSNWSSAH